MKRKCISRSPDQRFAGFGLGLGLVLGLIGCDGGELDFSENPQIRGPYATASSLVYLDDSSGELAFAKPTKDKIEVKRTSIVGDKKGKKARRRIAWGQSVQNGRGFLSLSVPKDAKHEDEDEVLFYFDADGDLKQEYPIGAAFTSVALSPDERKAIFYFGTSSDLGRAQDEEFEELPPAAGLQNANQVAIVDFESEDIKKLTLNGFGGRLERVHFPAQVEAGEEARVQIGSAERDIAVFLAEQEIVLVDMEDDEPQQSQIAVNFNFRPEGTLLRPEDSLVNRPTLFVRSRQSADLAVLDFAEKDDGERFTANLNLVQMGSGIDDFVYADVDEDGDGDQEVPYLVAVSSKDSGFVFVELQTHNTFRIGVGEAVSRIFLRDTQREDGELTQQAVAWRKGGKTLHTLELAEVRGTLGQRPSKLAIEGSIDDLVVLDNDRALVASSSVLYVVEFESERVTPMNSSIKYDVQSSALDADHNLLFLGASDQNSVAWIDLANLNPELIVLDERVRSFHYLRHSNMLVANHGGNNGFVTVVQSEEPSRRTAYTEWGFLFGKVLGE